MPAVKRRPLTEEEQKVVEANMGLVYGLARCWRHPKTPVDDRIQAGAIGLMMAVEGFDPARGAFSTYATKCIRAAIQTVELDSHVIKVPGWVRFNHADPAEQAKAGRFHADRDRAFKTAGGVCDDDVAGVEPGVSAVDDADEAAWMIGKLGRLTAKQRDVLRSLYWDGEDCKRIGKRYGVSRTLVHLWKTRALSSLRAMYEDEYQKGA